MKKTTVFHFVIITFMMTGILLTGCTREETVNDPANPYSDIVVLGNSITNHDIVSFWWGEWGMAASVREKDFVHQLENMLQETNPECVVRGYEIADWERKHITYDKSNFDTFFNSGTDLVIIRLGENVSNETDFDVSVQSMIDYVRSKVPDVRIIISGVFWTDISKDNTLKTAAFRNDLSFVELSSLNIPQFRSFIGAKVYDEEGSIHLINHSGVAAHPNDDGMRMIAILIYNEIMGLR